MSLTGRVALVTGGAGALGTVVGQRLRKEGCKVFASYHNEKEPLSPQDAQFKFLKTDATDESQVKRLFDAIVESSSHIDIVVNTVGGFVPKRPLTDVSLQDWESMMNLNLKSTFLSTREALRRMRGQSYGRVINISAMAAFRLAPERAPYAVSKAAVSLLTEIVSQEVKGTGITVNAIAPSIIATPANITSMPDEDSSKWVTPDQMADIICYLCSPAGGAITGTTVKAYGGV